MLFNKGEGREKRANLWAPSLPRPGPLEPFTVASLRHSLWFTGRLESILYSNSRRLIPPYYIEDEGHPGIPSMHTPPSDIAASDHSSFTAGDRLFIFLCAEALFGCQALCDFSWVANFYSP